MGSLAAALLPRRRRFRALFSIVQIGKDVWTFIEDNKPVATVNTDFAGAVPAAVGKNWASMAGWRDYAWGRKNPFEWVYKNGLHMTAVDLAWTWEWKCKGSYQGTGSYLTSVGVRRPRRAAAPFHSPLLPFSRPCPSTCTPSGARPSP